MSATKPVDDQHITRKKYTPACKAECVWQVAAGARQSDVARAQGISPAARSAKKIKRLRTELKRVEIERDRLKKAVPSECSSRIITASTGSKYVYSSAQIATWALANLRRVLSVSRRR